MLMKQWFNTMEYLRNEQKPFPHEPQLSNLYQLSKVQKNGNLVFVTVDTGPATYAIYKYLQQMTDKKLNSPVVKSRF